MLGVGVYLGQQHDILISGVVGGLGFTAALEHCLTYQFYILFVFFVLLLGIKYTTTPLRTVLSR